MAQDYDHIYREASGLENKIKNWLDDKQHSVARALLEQARQLVSEISQKKKPRQLEDRIKRVLRELHHCSAHGDAIMDHHHTDHLHEQYEELMHSLRKFDNY